MNVDKLIGAIPGMSAAERADMRTKALRMKETGTPAQQEAAERVLTALNEQAAVLATQGAAEAEARRERLSGMPLAQRVIEAFKFAPMTVNESKVIQALLDNPGASSTVLSRAYGHDNMIWQMHFGNLCKDREAYLDTAPKAVKRDGSFYSGILATFDAATSGFTMKPDVSAAFAELGLKAAVR
jgi:hypothetical protein